MSANALIVIICRMHIGIYAAISMLLRTALFLLKACQ